MNCPRCPRSGRCSRTAVTAANRSVGKAARIGRPPIHEASLWPSVKVCVRFPGSPTKRVTRRVQALPRAARARLVGICEGLLIGLVSLPQAVVRGYPRFARFLRQLRQSLARRHRLKKLMIVLIGLFKPCTPRTPYTTPVPEAVPASAIVHVVRTLRARPRHWYPANRRCTTAPRHHRAPVPP